MATKEEFAMPSKRHHGSLGSLPGSLPESLPELLFPESELLLSGSLRTTMIEVAPTMFQRLIVLFSKSSERAE